MADADQRAQASFNRIRCIWDSGRQAVAGWLQIPAPLVAESLALCGYDGLVIDMQHSPTDFATTVAMLTAIECRGVEPIVRIKSNDPGEIGPLLDAGAYGIIAPMVETARQTRHLVEQLHYPPIGKRSFGPRRPNLRFGPDYVACASSSIVSMAMIETLKGLDNLAQILDVDGLDGIFIGPADLALALGCKPQADSVEPAVVEAVRRIRETAHAAGRRVGIFTGSAAFAREKLDEGFDLVTLTPDLAMVTAQARITLRMTRSAAV